MLGNTRPHKGFSLGLVPLILAALFSLAACNTIEGMGKDMQDAGEAIEGEAQEEDEE